MGTEDSSPLQSSPFCVKQRLKCFGSESVFDGLLYPDPCSMGFGSRFFKKSEKIVLKNYVGKILETIYTSI